MQDVLPGKPSCFGGGEGFQRGICRRKEGEGEGEGEGGTVEGKEGSGRAEDDDQNGGNRDESEEEMNNRIGHILAFG